MKKIVSKCVDTRKYIIYIEVYDTLDGMEKDLWYIDSKIDKHKVRYSSNVKLVTVNSSLNVRTKQYIKTRIRKENDNKMSWLIKSEIKGDSTMYHLYIVYDLKEPIVLEQKIIMNHISLNNDINTYLREVLSEANLKIDRDYFINSIPLEVKNKFKNTEDFNRFVKTLLKAKKSHIFSSVCEVAHYVAGTPSSKGVLKKLGIYYPNDENIIPNVVLDYICNQC